jgi:hypothetical protein
VSDLQDSQEGKLTETPTDGVLCHVSNDLLYLEGWGRNSGLSVGPG